VPVAAGAVSQGKDRVAMLSRRKLSLAVLGLAVAVAAPSRADTPADKLVPPDAELAVVVNVRAALASPVTKKYALEQIQAALKGNQEAQKILGALGLDPLKDVDTVLVTADKIDPNGKPNAFVAARGNFDADKIAKVAAEAAKNGDLKIHKEGQLTVYEGKGKNPGDEPFFVVLKDRNTAVGSNSKEYLLDVLGGKAKQGKYFKDLQAALGKSTGKESLVTAMVLNDDIKAQLKANPQMAQLAEKLQSVTIAVTLTNDAELKILINTADEATARQVSKTVKDSLPLAKIIIQGQEKIPPFVGELIDKIKVSNDKGSVVISLLVDAATIEKAAKAIKP
jgi:hypothetical protein